MLLQWSAALKRSLKISSSRVDDLEGQVICIHIPVDQRALYYKLDEVELDRLDNIMPWALPLYTIKEEEYVGPYLFAGRREISFRSGDINYPYTRLIVDILIGNDGLRAFCFEPWTNVKITKLEDFADLPINRLKKLY